MTDSDEDDYLSEKFIANLAAASNSSFKKRQTASGSATYAERRREAARLSEEKNLANRIRSRKEVEEEARREGLSKSLFERAREEDEQHAKKRRKLDSDDADGDDQEDEIVPPTQNKALAMMLKMGFKEGETLGRKVPDSSAKVDDPSGTKGEKKASSTGHLIEPLPLAIWAGRQGLGRGTRKFAVPLMAIAKGNGTEENEQERLKRSQEAYRSRAREEFEEKRDMGRLASARKTLINLDEKHGAGFDVRWIDPYDLETIPIKLRERIEEESDRLAIVGYSDGSNRGEAARLRAKMRAEALEPSVESENGYSEAPEIRRDDQATPRRSPLFNDETVVDTRDWLQLNARDRLRFTLEHLRAKYFYCFWCGAQYEDAVEMGAECPGESEEGH